MTDLIRSGDAAQYRREPLPPKAPGAGGSRISVKLLNATPDPLGSIAALCGIYEGRVVRDLFDVSVTERSAALAAMRRTVLNGPLEAVQFHFLIEGVSRSITHQMVRSRASFFAQESLRFAVPDENWIREVDPPPYLAGTRAWKREAVEFDCPPEVTYPREGSEEYRRELMRDGWDDALIATEQAYRRLVENGMPAEEARGLLPHDIPTRIHWVCDLRTLLTEAGKRTCTQAQFAWRIIFAEIARELREACLPGQVEGPGGRKAFGAGPGEEPGVMVRLCGTERAREYAWQFKAISALLRPVCYQTGSCGFMAEFDRGCSIRERVEIRSRHGSRDSSEWHEPFKYEEILREEGGRPEVVSRTSPGIDPAEWAANPGAART